MSLESTQVDLNDTNRSHEPSSKRLKTNSPSVYKHRVSFAFDFCSEARPIDLIKVKSSIKQVFINANPLADIPVEITNPDYDFSPSKDCVVPDIQLSSPFGYPASRFDFELTPEFNYNTEPRDYDSNPLFKWSENNSPHAKNNNSTSNTSNINFDFARLSKQNLLEHNNTLDKSIVPDSIEEYFSTVPDAPDTIQTVKLRSRLKFNSTKPETKKSTRIQGGTPAPFSSSGFNSSRYNFQPQPSLDVTPLDAPQTIKSIRTDTKSKWSSAKSSRKNYLKIIKRFSPSPKKKKTIETIVEEPSQIESVETVRDDTSLCSTLVDSPSGQSDYITDEEFDSCGFNCFDPYDEMHYQNEFYDPETGQMIRDVNTPSKACNIKPFDELYPETPETCYFADSDSEASFDPNASADSIKLNPLELSNVTIRRRPRKRKFSEVSDSNSSRLSESQTKKQKQITNQINEIPLSDSFQTKPFENNPEPVDDLGTKTPDLKKSKSCKAPEPDASKVKWSEAKFKMRQVFADRIAKPNRKKSIDAGVNKLFTHANISIQTDISTQDQPLSVPFELCVKPDLKRMDCQIGGFEYLPSGESQTIDAYFLSNNFD